MTNKPQDKPKKEGSYKYKCWSATTTMDKIMKEVESLEIKGWSVVSHSHSSFGLSIIFKK